MIDVCSLTTFFWQHSQKARNHQDSNPSESPPSIPVDHTTEPHWSIDDPSHIALTSQWSLLFNVFPDLTHFNLPKSKSRRSVLLMEPGVFVPWKSLMKMRLHYWRKIDRMKYFNFFFAFLCFPWTIWSSHWWGPIQGSFCNLQGAFPRTAAGECKLGLAR